MKRTIGLLSLIALLIMCLSGCEHDIVEDTTSARVEGYWETIKVKVGDEVFEDHYLDPQIPISAVYSLAVAHDGTGYLDSPVSKLYGEANKQAFYWKDEDGMLKLYGKSAEDVLTLSYSEGKLIMKKDEDTELWFGKVDKLSEFDPSKVTAAAGGETK